MLLNQMKHSITRFYDLNLPYVLEDFISYDRKWYSAVSGATQHLNEALLIQQSDDTLDLTLFLDQATVQRATDVWQKSRWNLSDLDAVCTVAEGISHLICLLWHAHHGRELRPVDLELQADVDKFVLLEDLLTSPHGRRALHHWLFSRMSFRDEPGSALHWRYMTANNRASCYCQWLIDYPMSVSNDSALATELRRFYRLSGQAKMRRIGCLDQQPTRALAAQSVLH